MMTSCPNGYKWLGIIGKHFAFERMLLEDFTRAKGLEAIRQ